MRAASLFLSINERGKTPWKAPLPETEPNLGVQATAYSVRSRSRFPQRLTDVV